jgi:hypothetical protein
MLVLNPMRALPTSLGVSHAIERSHQVLGPLDGKRDGPLQGGRRQHVSDRFFPPMMLGSLNAASMKELPIAILTYANIIAFAPSLALAARGREVPPVLVR